MKFRLIYKGPLRGNKSKATEKHTIRLQIHPQIQTIWQYNPFKTLVKARNQRQGVSQNENNLTVAKFGMLFLPLLSEESGLRAGLDILLLEPLSSLGKKITRGDIDNKIKSLIDGLRMPRSEQELPQGLKESCPSPLNCLLEDDSLIGDFAVRTDRLLGNHDDGIALAIIEVNIPY